MAFVNQGQVNFLIFSPNTSKSSVMILLMAMPYFHGKYLAFGQITNLSVLLDLESKIKATREVPDDTIEILQVRV